MLLRLQAPPMPHLPILIQMIRIPSSLKLAPTPTTSTHQRLRIKTITPSLTLSVRPLRTNRRCSSLGLLKNTRSAILICVCGHKNLHIQYMYCTCVDLSLSHFFYFHSLSLLFFFGPPDRLRVLNGWCHCIIIISMVYWLMRWVWVRPYKRLHS